ncbi:MAG: DUF402 domain-containing protein, partial [Nocardioides sp.]|uniref:DUF402 domain-containing protein n=1 Tax=Nocardioides sp. TaxID=35761 RepID=UPI003D6ADAE0
PHWAFDGLYLGEDEHGEWIGHPVGTFATKPGGSYTSGWSWLTLSPRQEPAHLVRFNGHGQPDDITIYVDMTTPAEWSGTVLSCVDLDLDVIELRDGRVLLIDEDEFAEHQVALHYPPEAIDLAQATADRVLPEVTDSAPPYDGEAPLPWFEVLTSFSR